jgi:AcrR family transcriptional regulator
MRASKRKSPGGGSASARKGRILAAAVEIFSRYGYHEAEVEAIAKVAGVAKGTVYNHYADKHALFMGTVEFAIQRLSERIAGSTRGIDDPAAALDAAIDSYLSFLRDNRNLHRILFLHRSTLREAEELRFAEKYLAHFTLLEPVLADGVARGAFGPVDVRVASFAITGLMLAAYRGSLAVGADRTATGYFSPIKRIVFEGLAPACSPPADVPHRSHGGATPPKSNFK